MRNINLSKSVILILLLESKTRIDKALTTSHIIMSHFHSSNFNTNHLSSSIPNPKVPSLFRLILKGSKNSLVVAVGWERTKSHTMVGLVFGQDTPLIAQYS